MRGTVIKRGPGRWSVVLDLGHDANGKRIRKWHSGYRTRKAAEAARVELLGQLQHGAYVDPTTLTLREYVGRWLDYMAALGRDERTVGRYRELLDDHVLPYLGGLPVQRLSPLHLSDTYALLLREGHAQLVRRRLQAGRKRRDNRPPGLSPRTVGHVHRALHRALAQAVRWQLVSRNVATGLELPSVPKSEMVTLTREQAGALLDAAERRPLLRWLVLLGVATGARLGELLALRWADVDLEAGTLRIGASRRIVNKRVQVKGPKTEAGYRTVRPDPATLAALKRLRAEQAGRRLALGQRYHDHDLVISKPDGAPYRPDSVSGMFRDFADAQGLPKAVHVHTLRHSAASFLAAAGVPASDIAAQLGHKDGGALALRVYVHPLAEGLERAGVELGAVLWGR